MLNPWLAVSVSSSELICFLNHHVNYFILSIYEGNSVVLYCYRFMSSVQAVSSAVVHLRRVGRHRELFVAVVFQQLSWFDSLYLSFY